MKTSRAYGLLLATAAIALFATLYAEAMTVPFYFDDVIWVTRGLRADLPVDLFRPGHFNFVRPTTVLWYHLWAPICATTPLAWRLAAAALFLVTAATLHALGRALGQGRLGAAVTVLFFVAAAHHWELIYGVSTVGDLLVGFFTIGGLTAWIRWRREGSRSAWTVSLIGLGLALGSKESAMVTPLLLLAYELLHTRGARELPGAAARVAPHLTLALAWLGLDASLVRAAGKGVAPIHPPADVLGLWGSQIAASLLTVPVRDAAGPCSALAGAAALAAWGALLAVVAVWRGGRLRNSVGFAMGWITLAWLPYLLLVPDKLDQDRYGYLASIGTALLVGFLTDGFATRTQHLDGRTRPLLMAGGLIALMAVVGWNGRCQRQAAADLRQWLARRGDVADRVREIASTCPAGTPVYIFSDPGTWHEAGYAFALFSDRPLAEVRDGWDLPGDRPAHHHALLWNQEVACYVDLRDLATPPIEGSEPSGFGWNDVGEWTRDALSNGSVGGRVTNGDETLGSPLMSLSVWGVDRVVVEYRAWVESGAGGAATAPSSRTVRMWLTWSNRSDGGFVKADTVSAPLITDGQTHQAIFIPWLSPRWWRGERVRRLGITPADRPARVEIMSVRVMPPLPAAARRHIE